MLKQWGDSESFSSSSGASGSQKKIFGQMVKLLAVELKPHREVIGEANCLLLDLVCFGAKNLSQYPVVELLEEQNQLVSEAKPVKA